MIQLYIPKLRYVAVIACPLLSQDMRRHRCRKNQRLPKLSPRNRIALSPKKKKGIASAQNTTPSPSTTTHHVPLHHTKRPRDLHPTEHLQLDPPLEHDLALVVPAHPKSVHRPRSRDDGGVLVFDLERVEAFLDEVDEDARSDRGVEAGELWGVPSAALGLGLAPGG